MAQQIRTHKSGTTNIPPTPVARPRFDLDDDFTDVMGDSGVRFKLANEDPSRHYVWAHNSTEDIQHFMMDNLGWKVEYFAGYEQKAGKDKDGKPIGQDDVERPKGVYVPGLLGVLKEGERLVVADHVLVSCDREKKEKREFYQANKHQIEYRKLRGALDEEKVYAAGAQPGRRN